MTETEFQKTIKLLVDLFAPDKVMTAAQVQAFGFEWLHKPANIVQNAIRHCYNNDTEHAKYSKVPTPAHFRDIINNSHQTHNGYTEVIDVPYEERQYQLCFISAMLGLLRIKRKTRLPETDAIHTFRFPLDGGGYRSVVDNFVLCWNEFGQHVRNIDTFLGECDQVMPGLGECIERQLEQITHSNGVPT